MTAAAELLSRLHAHGVRARLIGDRVRLEADRPPPPDLLEQARAARAELVEHLREKVERCGTLADACPLLLDCPLCGVTVWRPIGATACLRCADDPLRAEAAHYARVLVADGMDPAEAACVASEFVGRPGSGCPA